MTITLGQFLNTRKPDDANDPYDPQRESFLEVSLPNGFEPSVPAQLPNPPSVVLSNPTALPPSPEVTLTLPTALPQPPDVTLSIPAAIPFEPAPPLRTPDQIPFEPAPPLRVPDNIPFEPAPPLRVPDVLPDPPPFVEGQPAVLPPPPDFTEGVPAVLPDPPSVTLSVAEVLPPPPDVVLGSPAILPDPPDFIQPAQKPLPPPPDFSGSYNSVADPNKIDPKINPDAGYTLGDKYSLIDFGQPGSQAADPQLYERQLERLARLPPEKIPLFVLQQTTMFAQNTFGNVWNPGLLAPPPILQDFMQPALDLPPGGTLEWQVQLGDLIDQAMSPNQIPNPGSKLIPGVASPGVQPTLSRMKTKDTLIQAFDNVRTVLSNGNQLNAVRSIGDKLKKIAFNDGIIPARLKGDADNGSRTFAKDDLSDDDDSGVPLAFTDLRTNNNVYRAVYFRPLNVTISENFSPEWNMESYIGRVDPVASYQATTRNISLSFQVQAFGPEDVRTNMQKIHWLQSMVYPSYDANLMYKAGPVARLRVGDIFNSKGVRGGRGLPGVITSLDIDYSDALWELKKDWKVPRSAVISVGFTVIHDTPIGLGDSGFFGGLGEINSDGKYVIRTVNSGEVKVFPKTFRDFGGSEDLGLGSSNG